MALKPLNSVAGFSVGEIPANIILANGDITTTNITTTGISNLNSISNVRITGGSSGQVISTDGLGNLSFATINTSQLANGNSNVQVYANSNVAVSVAGNANIFTVTGTGANVNGRLTVTGNSTTGNILPAVVETYNLGSSSNYWADIYTVRLFTDIILPINNNGNVTISNDNGTSLWKFTDSGNLVLPGNTLAINYANGTQIGLQNIANGNSNIQVYSNSNVAVSVAGNSNVFTVTGTGANVTGYITASGNITGQNANLGNLAVANFANIASNTITNNLTVNLEIQANTANFDGNVTMDSWLTVANTANVGNLRTDNLLYANGLPWDLQEAAGNNNEIQFNLNDNFAASANFTYNDTTQVLTVTGNANVTNTLLTPNVNSGSGNLSLTANGFTTTFTNTGNVIFPAGATISGANFVGNISGNIIIPGSNTGVVFNDDGDANSTLGFTFDKTSNLVTIRGNIDLGPAGDNEIVNNSNTAVEIRGGWNKSSGTGVNLVAGDYANSANWGKLSIQGNVSGNSVGFSEANAFVFTNPGYGLGNVVKVDILNPAATSTTTGVIQANGGIGVTGNGYFGGLISATGTATAGNLSTSGTLSVTGNANVGNIGATGGVFTTVAGNLTTAAQPNITSVGTLSSLSVSGNITSGNASLGNLASANFVNVANRLTTLDANVTGVLTIANANITSNLTVNNLTVNLDLAGNTANFTGNITSLNANLGNLVDANFIRTQEIYNGNSNVIVAANGNVTISSNGVSNVLTVSNSGANVVGTVSANGSGTFGSLLSNTLTAQSGNLTIYAAAGNNYVELRPTGSGHVDVGNFKIQNLGAPNASSDAATKQYVDDIAQGLHVHAPCYTATSNTLAILTGGTITYNNGTGGVGANLVLSGSPTANYTAANTFDGNTTAVVGSRILVKNEANTAHNGIYVVDSATVLTRATDFNTPTEMAGGDFTFVQNGDNYNDTGWVMTDPVTTVGTSPVVFVQFSGAGTYQAGAGLTLTGTVFSVNVDNLTTEIAGGNVVVKANAQLTTPNIGAATGTSLNLTGNVLAENLNANALVTAANINVTSNVLATNFNANSNITTSNLTVNLQLSGNTANFTGNVTAANFIGNVTGNISGNITVPGSNTDVLFNNAGNIGASNAFTFNSSSNVLTLTGNLSSQNANLGNLATANFANISSNVISNNITVNLELAGNTANFSGNVIVPNLSVNNNIAGNTANFTGNISAANANLGNLATANFVNVSSNLNVTNTANVGNLRTDNLLYANGTPWDFQEAAGANTQIQYNINNNFAASANFTYNDSTQVLRVTGTANIANAVVLGNTNITWATLTTTATTANQTIASFAVSGITGVEYLIKGVDSTGSKYSVATVQAVTDGTTADYSVFGTVNIGGSTGTLAVNISGSNLVLQVTPASSNSTVWTTQYRLI